MLNSPHHQSRGRHELRSRVFHVKYIIKLSVSCVALTTHTNKTGKRSKRKRDWNRFFDSISSRWTISICLDWRCCCAACPLLVCFHHHFHDIIKILMENNNSSICSESISLPVPRPTSVACHGHWSGDIFSIVDVSWACSVVQRKSEFHSIHATGGKISPLTTGARWVVCFTSSESTFVTIGRRRRGLNREIDYFRLLGLCTLNHLSLHKAQILDAFDETNWSLIGVNRRY